MSGMSCTLGLEMRAKGEERDTRVIGGLQGELVVDVAPVRFVLVEGSKLQGQAVNLGGRCCGRLCRAVLEII